MCVQNFRSFTASKRIQSLGATAIDSRLSMQVFNNKAISAKFLAEFSNFVQNSNNASVLFTESTHHHIDQHFGSTNPQSMNDMTDGGTRRLCALLGDWICGCLNHSVCSELCCLFSFLLLKLNRRSWL